MQRMLTAAISTEVAYRHQELQLDQPLQRCIATTSQWLINPDRQGLLIMGTLGNGKTTMVGAIENIIRVMDICDPHTEKRVLLRCVSALHITRLAKDDYSAFKELCLTPMLAIDDYGTEPAEIQDYGNIMRPMDELLYTRYSNQLATIMTTNLTNEQLRARTADRLYDRFREMFKVIIFTNPSYRGQ